MTCRYLPNGDRMVLVEFSGAISRWNAEQVHALARKLEQSVIPGIKQWVLSYLSLGVIYEPGEITYEQMVQRLRELEGDSSPGVNWRYNVFEVPVCYGGVLGPDLAFVSAHNHLSPEDVIQLHSEGDYLVCFLGFTPGFPYLDGLSPRIATPRLETPRSQVPAGSVGIGGSQTGIYSVPGPGGWRIIGRTPLKLFDPGLDSPFLFQAGDFVQFRPISQAEYLRLETESSADSQAGQANYLGRPHFESE